jgi:hypothetical protein
LGLATAVATAGFFYNVAFHLLVGRIYDDKDVQERIVRGSKLVFRETVFDCYVMALDIAGFFQALMERGEKMWVIVGVGVGNFVWPAIRG